MEKIEEENAAAEEVVNDGNVDEADAEKSPVSKFKSSAALKKAYESLEAEFTRKSQKVKELEKLLETLKTADESAAPQVEPSAAPQVAQDSFKAPYKYELGDWAQRVADFTAQNKYAAEFAKEICEEILNDAALAAAEKPLDDAWARVAGRHFKSEQDLAQDENFLSEHVFKNEKIKEKIIKDYISQKDRTFVPTLISGAASGFAISKKAAPLTFEEAKKQAEKLFGQD